MNKLDAWLQSTVGTITLMAFMTICALANWFCFFLVTGNVRWFNGFIGSVLVYQLCRMGWIIYQDIKDGQQKENR